MMTVQFLLWGLLGAVLTYALVTIAALGVIAGVRAVRGRCPCCGREGKTP